MTIWDFLYKSDLVLVFIVSILILFAGWRVRGRW